MDVAPIIVFAHRRPGHLLALLESLRADPLAAKCRLTIYCDGPRNAEEHLLVAEVRQVARLRRWCGDVAVIERDDNLGLANSILGGVNAALEHTDRVIVLEDDLVVAPQFLKFMNEALTRYERADRVMQISGYMFPIALPHEVQACLLPMISSWGWATWRRAWAAFDPDAVSPVTAGKTRRRFDLDGSYPFAELLDRQRAGHIDSWAIRWYRSVFERHGLTLFPARSYVRNEGWDGSGTHCGRDSFYDTTLWTEPVTRYPSSIEVSEQAYARLKTYFCSRFAKPGPGLLQRITRRLSRLWQITNRPEECER